MAAEDKIADNFKRQAFKSNPFTFAFKRKDLEKLFAEIMLSNLAIESIEVWLVEEETQVVRLIPLLSGKIKVFNQKIEPKEKSEDWFDFVERSVKTTQDIINTWDLEKRVQIPFASKIWYHFEFKEELILKV